MQALTYMYFVLFLFPPPPLFIELHLCSGYHVTLDDEAKT